MPKWTDALKSVLATVAPTIGVALGGPLGGAAGTVLAKALGKEGAPVEELEAAIVNATPETLLKLKEAEIEFQKFLTDADIKLVELDAGDRANARSREIALRDWTPSILAFVIVAGFFGVIGWMLKWDIPPRGEQALLLLLGALSAAFAGVIAYYFGSSAGSRNKQQTIDAVIGKK